MGGGAQVIIYDFGGGIFYVSLLSIRQWLQPPVKQVTVCVA